MSECISITIYKQMIALFGRLNEISLRLVECRDVYSPWSLQRHKCGWGSFWGEYNVPFVQHAQVFSRYNAKFVADAIPSVAEVSLFFS